MKTLVEKAVQRLWYGFPEDPIGRLISGLLSPAQHLYRMGLERDQAARRARRRTLPVPVISVGNLTVGGTGKTPLVRWITRYLTDRGVSAAVLSRGYGRRVQGSAPARVDCRGPKRSLSARYGDEPVMLACGPEPVPVWVGRNRWEAGMEAVRQDGARVLVLDDGFQYVQLSRSLDVVVLDARRPLGNGRLLPAGPLREPPEALRRAHVIVFMEAPFNAPSSSPPKRGSEISSKLWTPACAGVTGGGAFGQPPRPAEARSLMKGRDPGFHGDVEMTKGKILLRARPVIRRFVQAATGHPVDVTTLRHQGCVAVCGIARPQRFFAALKAQGIAAKTTWIFGDHHRFRESECRKIVKSLDRLDARWIVTTEKDAVRLPPSVLERAVFPLLDLDFGEDGPVLAALLDEVCSSGR
ncbi:lipid-A-disaccharide kinase [Desulfacinum infernum DSM 9756]|uniref:Tetraacyldisaccharide 4'-kinase n=1 Tax=Desulfacinum infernum DSM 9756 TaxID=1121391 RepID=A0A1M5I3X2_9BACT|nr:tetraacyldisaccharide 4'-kinase [Desulfacinum infernum]SHG22932.1 lipid-A-disaccharide kinase [Desulfacinum infernum DSM 9756]